MQHCYRKLFLVAMFPHIWPPYDHHLQCVQLFRVRERAFKEQVQSNFTPKYAIYETAKVAGH